ncbi:MAG: twin-arginine translocation signal domain-containing protein, partial [Bacteroidota bacterium]
MLSRRDFLGKSGLGVLGLSLASRLTSLAAAEGRNGVAGSKVVLVRHSEVVDNEGRIQQPLLQEMLDEALTSFTGKGSIADAWR